MARGVEGQRKADLGDGRYLNPIMAGDHPDPSILKDGDDYYMTFSSFESYPGLVIWHSRDLVNWTPVGAGPDAPIGSVWALELCKHERPLLHLHPAPTPAGRRRTIFVIWADRIEGPWSDPIDLNMPGLHRPRPCGRRGRQALPVPQRRRPGAAGATTAWPPSARSSTSTIRWRYPDDWVVEIFAPEGPEDHAPRRLVLPDHGGGRHGGPADQPYGHRRPLALDPRPVGGLPAQSARAHAATGRALVVARPRHPGRGPGRRLVDGLSRL